MTERRFRIHESTRRSFCRLAFVLLGFVPLAICTGLSLSTLLPGYSRRQAVYWEQRLSKHFGLTIRIDQVKGLAPYEYRLQGIEWLHPESQRLMGTLNNADVRYDKGKWLVQLTSVWLAMDQLSEGCRAVHDGYICRPLNERHWTSVQIDSLTFDAGDQKAELKEVAAEFFPESVKWGLRASFRLGSSSDAIDALPANQFLLIRHHDPEMAATEMQLRANTGVPLWLVAPAIELHGSTSHERTVQTLLENCQFTGVMDIRRNIQETTICVNNSWIDKIDFGLVHWQTPPAISGRGRLHLAHAKLDSQGLQWAEGLFEMGPGRIDSKLFHSLTHYLHLDTPRQNPTEAIAFDRLAARFRIQPDALQFIGAMEDGAVLGDAHGALARRLDSSAISVSNVIHALAASPSSASLVRKALVWLPLDDVQRRETAQVLRISRY